MYRIVFGLCLAFLLPVVSNAQIEVPSGKGISFNSTDDLFKAKMGFRLQNLVTVEDQTGASPSVVNALVRRSRFKFDGYLLDTVFTFKFEMGMSNRDIGARSDFAQVNSSSRLILDAVGKIKPLPGLEIWFGQTKLPGNRERVVSSQKLQFVDRSLLNSRLNIDRDMGAQVHYKFRLKGKAVYKVVGSISKGEGRNITVDNMGGLDYTGRVEWLPFGSFTKGGDYFLADLKRESTHKLSIGATFDYNDNASRQRGQLGNFTVDTAGNAYQVDLQTYFVDLIYKYKGFSLMAEYGDKFTTHGLKEDNSDKQVLSSKTPYFTGTSENVQMGYLFKNNYEIAVRYTALHPDTEESGLSETTQYTLGFSKYIIGHSLKIQTDVSMAQTAGNPGSVMLYRMQLEMGF